MLISEAQERERERLLPLHHGDGGDVDGEEGDLSDSAPPEFSPSNLQPPGLCFLFLSCGGSPFEERRGGALYIGVFMLRGSFGKKD